jgi:hypothetical protein
MGLVAARKNSVKVEMMIFLKQPMMINYASSLRHSPRQLATFPSIKLLWFVPLHQHDKTVAAVQLLAKHVAAQI